MSLTLVLPAEAQAQLQEFAEEEGRSAEETAALFLLAELARRRRALEQTIKAILEGLADSAAGRVTPLAEWDAKFRARHGISENAEPMTHEEALLLP